MVVRCISICRAVIRHLQGSKLTRDMMVMKAVTAWCCRVRSAAPEIQFPTEQRGSILYSFLLYPLHKIFSHLQNKKVRNNVFLYIKIDFWHGRSGRSWLSYPITFLCMSTYWKIMTPDKTKTKMAAVSSLIFLKNNKSVSAKIITGRFCRQRKVKTFSSCGAHFRSDDNIFFFSNCNDNSVHHSKDAFV